MCNSFSRNTLLIALISFGVESTQKIAYFLNFQGIKYIILHPEDIPKFEPTHIILSGGPDHVYEKEHHSIPQWVINSSCPVLGICYGMQIIAHTFGGSVVSMLKLEKGPVEVTEIITDGKSKNQITELRWMNRYDQVVSVPNIFSVTGVTHKNHIAAFTDHKKWWAVQYHPESKKYGDKNIFRRFFRLKPYPQN